MVKTILILAANPKDTSRLRLDQEVREIDNGLQMAVKRKNFILKQIWAVRPSDFRRAMLKFKPNIIHFCGHGTGEEGIAFENIMGNAELVNAEALASFFELFADHVECVILNACYSELQADAIAQHIKYVIGMRRGIEDNAAIEFAVAFYDALGAGETFDFAYKLACNAIQWATAPEHLTPILKSNILQSLLSNVKYSSPTLDVSRSLATSSQSLSSSKDINALMRDVNNLVGLQPVKTFINQQVSRIALEIQLNKSQNQTESQLGNMVFTGKPGTGKSTVAYLLSHILKQLGTSSKGHFIVTSRAEFIGEYVGQTAVKTREIVEQALDGILFIDEAYSLNSGSNDFFGKEALSTLIPLIELYRHRLIVIASGYPEEMEMFLQNNVGLSARFPHRIHFPDYTVEELLVILDRFAESAGYTLSAAVRAKARYYFQYRKDIEGTAFGNARGVRSLLESMKAKCAERIFRENINVQERPIIEEEDIPDVFLNVKPPNNSFNPTPR